LYSVTVHNFLVDSPMFWASLSERACYNEGMFKTLKVADHLLHCLHEVGYS